MVPAFECAAQGPAPDLPLIKINMGEGPAFAERFAGPEVRQFPEELRRFLYAPQTHRRQALWWSTIFRFQDKICFLRPHYGTPAVSANCRRVAPGAAPLLPSSSRYRKIFARSGGDLASGADRDPSDQLACLAQPN